eukprot:gene31629-41062_t
MNSIRKVIQRRSTGRGAASVEQNLFDAAGRDNLTEVAAAIKKGVDVNWKNEAENDCTALNKAADWGYRDVVTLLLERGAHPNLADKYGDTPLHKAAQNGHREIILLLLERGADPNLARTYGSTSLHIAAEQGQEEVVSLLLKRGADPNLTSMIGKKPIDLAREKGWTEVVSMLEMNMPVQVSDVTAAFEDLQELDVLSETSTDTGKTNLCNCPHKLGRVPFPLDTSYYHSDDCTWTCCDQEWSETSCTSTNPNLGGNSSPSPKRSHHDSSIKSPKSPVLPQSRAGQLLFSATERGNLTDVVAALDAGADINWKNEDRSDCTALFVAAKNAHQDVMKLLLDRGANPNLPSKSGTTALHMTSQESCHEVVALLLERGADPNLIEKRYGETALHWAAEQGHRDIIALLLERGANPNLTNQAGKKPIDVARTKGHGKVVALLEKVSTGQIDQGLLLFDAAENGNLTEVVAALDDAGADVNWKNEYQSDCTALFIATKNTHRDIVATLLDRGANPNLVSKNGNTPLLAATYDGHRDIVILLLERGADPNIAEKKYEETALHWAAERGHPEIAALLLERGADRNLKNKVGKKPIAVARAEGNDAVVSLLEDLTEQGPILYDASKSGNLTKVVAALDAGADVNFKNVGQVDCTPLFIASKNNHRDIVVCLLDRGANPNLSNKNGNTPLHAASNEGHRDIVDVLLQRGASRNPANRVGKKPVDVARAGGHGKIVSLLESDSTGRNLQVLAALDSGADLNWKNKKENECTALFVAAKNAHQDVMKLLLDRGANPNLPNKNGTTPLHMTAQKSSPEVVTILLEQGADPNLTEKNYVETSLHWAAEKGHRNIVALLLERGADPNLTNQAGRKPIDVARAKGHRDVVSLLEKDNSPELLKQGKNLFDASENGDILEVVAALDAGADIYWRHRDASACHSLFIAAKKGHHDIVTLLLDRGANPNLANKNGNTPLHAAAHEGHSDVVTLLLKRGANRNLVSKAERKPIDAARANGHYKIVSLLDSKPSGMHAQGPILFEAAERGNLTEVTAALDAGADVNWQNEDRTDCIALFIAARNFHEDVMTLLLDWGANPNLASKNGTTALHMTAQRSSRDVVALLMDRGADPNLVEQRHGETALHWAAEKGHRNIVALLLERGADRNLINQAGKRPIDVARAEGHGTIVSLLEKDSHGLIEKGLALYDASKGGNLSKVIAALDAGADVNWKNDDQNDCTSLFVAAKNNHSEVVIHLLEKGGNPNLSSTNGNSPLHAATYEGHRSVMVPLLERGADPNLVEKKYGETTLHWAAEKGHRDIAALLIERGADRNIKNKAGKKPIDVARARGHGHVVTLLEMSSPGLLIQGQKLFDAAERGNMTDVVAALDAGADVNWKNDEKNDRTALQKSAEKNHVNVVEILLNRGANPNLCNKNGTTSLHTAAQEGHREVVNLLLKARANPNIAENQKGKKSIDSARARSRNKIVSLLEMTNLFDKDGKNPVDYAREGNHAAVVALLKRVQTIYKDDSSCLVGAMVGGHYSVVELLLQIGADISTASSAAEGSTSRAVTDSIRTLLESTRQ